jgi:outer membrane murein-binding lipoprotein Lpp
MVTKTLAIAALAATLLAGCSQQARVDNAYAQRTACINASNNSNPEFVAWKASHANIGTSAALADERLPTPAEVGMVVATYDASAGCRQNFLFGIARTSNRPDAASVMAALYAQRDDLVARFSKGNMTWGQFNRAIADLNTAWITQTAAVDAEHRRDAIAAAAVLGAAQPWQPVQNMPQHIYVSPCTLNAQIARVC